MMHLKVTSPRIVFFDFLRFTGRFFKLGLALVVMVGVGVALGFGWQKLFVENKEFVIRKVEIHQPGGEETRFLTHGRLVKKTGLDLEKTIFAVDTGELAEALAALPEISSAKVNRRLPGTLKIEVTERVPIAWLACDSLGIEGCDRAAGLLVGSDGVPFRCDSVKLWEFAKKLPVVSVEQADEGAIREGEALEHRGLSFALDLVKLANKIQAESQRPALVRVKDEILLEMVTRSGVIATMSYYDQEEQLQRLAKLTLHAQRKKQELDRVNLIPRRFVPVHYKDRNGKS
jgi:hypothetical protein